ncbi:MAG: glutathione synthase [Proteobacteria bacterium]|nr:MAG: glutathione synthase [Pseudomonadota bacterium]
MKLAVVMDPIESINPKKDSSFAMLLAAQNRGHQLHYIRPDGLFTSGGQPAALNQVIKVQDQAHNYFSLGPITTSPLTDFDCIAMRKDPPFDMEYIMDTYILELAEIQGVLVFNKPQALRDANEKFFTEFFTDFTPANRISRNPELLRQAVHDLDQVIIKPMDGMGGQSIFKTSKNDKNLNVILETVTQNGTQTTIVQKFIPEISAGDKRILLINGEAVPYALARIPSDQDFRGNLAKGGTGKGVELSQRDWAICEAVGPVLKSMGIVFAGIDVIGDYLTEINVTSPTCIRELDELYDLDIAGDLIDTLEKML